MTDRASTATCGTTPFVAGQAGLAGPPPSRDRGCARRRAPPYDCPVHLAAPVAMAILVPTFACSTRGYSGPACDPCADVSEQGDGAPPGPAVCGPDGTSCSPGSVCTCDTCGNTFICGPGADGIVIDCSAAGTVCNGPEPPCSCPPCPSGTIPVGSDPCDGCLCGPPGSSGSASGGTSPDSGGADDGALRNDVTADATDAGSDATRE
jgi:hypothetical protein